MKEVIFREDVIRAAQKLFQTFGLKKTTMEDIAKAMGKGKSTLYYYYQSKEQIFEDVLQSELQEVFNVTKSAVEKARTAEEKLRAFAVTKITVLTKMINLYKLVCGEMMWQPTCSKELFSEYTQQDIQLIASILESGIQSGEFKAQLSDEMDILPSLIVSSIRGIERDYFSNKLSGLENRINVISGIMTEGLKNHHQTTTK
ncbi:MAG: TetR/AcrR family transcriptional regulator [Sediminibacterium sp.]|nr:TetR/AcrR family transcriptional regulator [Sediminibacterium sp.]